MAEIPMKAARKCLSSDCWEAIFSYLGDEDLKSVSLTCKDFLAYSSALKKGLKVVHPDIGMLSRHLNRFAHLKTINLLHFEGNTYEAIRKIACSGIELEALHTSFPKPRFLFRIYRPLIRIPEYLFQNVCVSELLSNLKACTFSGEFGDDELAAVADNYPNLEELRFERYSFSKKIPSDSSGLELLASKLRLLRKIHLFSFHACDQFIVALSLNCVFLKDVTILSHGTAQGDQSNQGVTENAVGQLLRNRPNLEALFVECVVKDDSVSPSSLITIEDSISHAKALTSLVLGGMGNTDKVLAAIAKAKLRLSNLGLIACRDLTVSGLLLVVSNHLTKLRIERASLTDQDMKLLLKGDVGKLTHIEIIGGHVTKSTLFLILTKCPSLVDIRMVDTGLDGRVQDVPLSKNYKVQSLCLEGCYGVTGRLLKLLGRLFPNLKVLELSGCHAVTTKQIQAILKRCKHVRKLDLTWFKEAKMIEGDGSKFPVRNLEVLKLSYSKIDDEGLAVIAKKCPRLLSLDLSNCKNIRTETIKLVVQNIKTLTSLNLTRCGDNNFGALLGWMLFTGNLASLKKIVLLAFTKEERDLFLQRGCLLLQR